MSKDKKITDDYNASSIEVLEGLEAVRKRPEMYIGSRGPKGLHHLVWEVVDNSVDEKLAGHCDEIDVTINKDGSMTIADNGRGMPVDMHEKMKKPAVEVILTVLHAGGKFSGKGYQVSGGLHGVGVKAVNALSKKLDVVIKRDGQIYTMSFSKGKKTKDLTSKKGKKGETGTAITFYPDSQIFAETIEFDRKTITDRLEETTYLNPKLRIRFKDLREETPYEKEFYSEKGIPELLEIKTKNLKVISNQTFEYSNMIKLKRINPDTAQEEIVDGYANVVFKYTNSEGDNHYNFVNNIRTQDGEHVKGFRQAIFKAFNQAARETKIIKEKETDIRDKDTLSGIVSIIYVKFPEPRFEGQTKEKLTSKEGQELVYNVIFDEAVKYFKKNKPLVKRLVDFAREQAKMREELKATKELTKDNSLLGNDALPGKLADCSSDNIEENELFVVEGDSAGGSAKQGRAREYQAILALRGKILNVQGKKVKDALSSNEVQAITAALGCGIKDMYDVSKLRYGKVIFLTDADVDGAHIQSLLMTFFYHYMKPLIDEGRLFIAKPPLYKVTFTAEVKKHKKGSFEYFYSDNELADFLKKVPESVVQIQRYKGLGEMNAEQLWETTLDPAVRKLDQVLVQDAIKAEASFETFMGKNNEDKVDFIRKVIKAYKLKKENVKHISDIEELAELDLSSDEITVEIEKRLSQYTNVIEKNIELKTITGVLKESIGDYAYYVNIKRSIPDIRDGLKPVQRRILWAMYTNKMFQNHPYKKCARVVGEVIGKYHPHGDSAVYEALVKLAQKFHENVPILDFHGNAGSIEGDGAAAMRYTETRLNLPAEDMMEYINYDTVKFEDNFSYEYKEPLFLPGKFPYVLVNGTQGLGVSVSTDIPAHNILEVLQAIEFVVDNPTASIKQIMKFIKGPDFPTGGILIDDNLHDVYKTGNGGYKVRAKMHTEIIKGQQALVITEIPYNVSTEQIIKKVRDAVKDKVVNGKIVSPKKISDILDYKDESDKRGGIRIIFFLKKTANAEEVKKQLYAYTPLEKSFKVNLLAVEHDEIKMFSLRDMIDSYIAHRQLVITKKFEYELKKKEHRKHLIEGFLKILSPVSNLDKAISIIRSSKDTPTAKSKLMKEFDLTDIQAQYILDRKLSTLSRADINSYKEELKQLKEEIVYIKKVLGDINEVNRIIKEDLKEMANKYPVKRRTEIMKKDKVEAIDQATEEVTNSEEIFVGLDVSMKFKKVKATENKKVIDSATTGTPMVYVEKTDSSQKLLGLTKKNYLVQANLEILPYSTDKNKRGVPYDVKREIKSTGTLDKIKVNYEGKNFVLLLFENGEIEKMPITYFQSAEYIYESKILDFLFVNEEDNFLIATKLGKLIVTEVSQFREAKRQSAINLDKKDKILSFDYYDENGVLLVITENNYTNMVPMNEFSPQTKGGKGIMYFKKGAKTGFPQMAMTLQDSKQQVHLQTDTESKVVKATDIADVATRTVIGKDVGYTVKNVVPLFTK